MSCELYSIGCLLWLVWVWLVTLSTCDFLLVLSYLLLQGWFNVNVFMSTCFVLTLSCLRAGLCGGWVSDLLWVGYGGSTCGGKFFLLNLQAVDLQLHWACEFSAGVFHAFCWDRLFATFLCGPPIPRQKRVNCNL